MSGGGRSGLSLSVLAMEGRREPERSRCGGMRNSWGQRSYGLTSRPALSLEVTSWFGRSEVCEDLRTTIMIDRHTHETHRGIQ